MKRYSFLRYPATALAAVLLLVSCQGRIIEGNLYKYVGADPATLDNSGFIVTPTADLHFTGVAPEVPEDYRLVVDGLVETPLSLSYEELLKLPSVTKVVLLICPDTFVDNAEWTGVRVSDILSAAGASPEAKEVVFTELRNIGLNPYNKALPMEDAVLPGTFVAYKVNGEPLPLDHGYPARLVVEGRYGYLWVKWLTRITVK